ncbi:hypothetical protein AB1A65_10965 [Muricauda sp. ANG21]|uniref:hypothetical protein n=1 Tax=Allomuricauda sp. ANG21 TaxID=3042468 RepID=UPI0034541FA1
MGGEGSMMHAIKSLKENRSLLKKRKLQSKDDVYGKKNVTKLYLKKSTPRDIARIKKMMFIEREKEKRRVFYAAIATILIVFVLYLLLT